MDKGEIIEGRFEAFNKMESILNDLETGQLKVRVKKLSEIEVETYINHCAFIIATKTNPLKLDRYIKLIIDNTNYSKKVIEELIKQKRRVFQDEQIAKDKKREALYNQRGFLKIDNYQDNVVAFHKENPFFYDRNKIFWFWSNTEFKYKIVDEVDLMCMLDKELEFGGQTVSGGLKSNYLEAFKRVGRMNIPESPSKDFIQFKDKIVNIKTGVINEVTPQYFFTNPIPFEIGETDQTPIMDKLFTEWVGEKHAKTLYQILAYCCYSAYPIQLLFCLWGNGRNGKSQYSKILDKFIGADNTTSTELDVLMDNRFESFKLYKKLVCSIGETNFGILDKSSLLKKITGGDKIGFEKKNKDPFDDYNYAKIIIGSNSLPSTNDTSDGFFRRWLIIDFPNEFEETGKEIWETVPEIEYNNLARKVLTVLKDLLAVGKFNTQGSIKDRKDKYISVSNPLPMFIKDKCEIKSTNFVSYNKLFTEYVNYLTDIKRRKVNRKEFKSALEDEGLYVEKTTKTLNGELQNGYFIDGINLVEDLPKPLIKQEVEEFVYDKIYQKCSVCGCEYSAIWHNNKPMCESCHKGTLKQYEGD